MAGGLISAPSAKAEDLVDFLWGGSPEYGGGRSLVSFDSQYKPGQIIVSFSDRRLYYIMKPGVALTYPVAVPMGEARWQGVTMVTSKRVNPPWTPTPDMVRANPRLPRWVPGGHPMNPLGIRAMYLGTSAYRIHGTDAPWTIGQAVSHGCIRMTNEDVLDLYPRIPVGTRVTVTWQQFKTQSISDARDIPRFTDKDSNPRAAAAAPAMSQQSASSDSSSSDSSANSYRTYAAGKGQTARVASNQSTGGGLESLFSSWDQPKQQSAPATENPNQSQAAQASSDATRDDDNTATEEPQSFAKFADSVAEKPAKKVHEAKVETEKLPPAETAKKKVSSTAVPKKKSIVTASKPSSVSDPSPEPLLAVPDPVKPTIAAPGGATGASKASIDSENVAHVQKASVQMQ
jgi:lipoprotein-anchoring transpeptidase ErfK/SrfK